MISTTNLTHAMVWAAETPQPLTEWGRTPTGVLFFILTIQFYVLQPSKGGRKGCCTQP